MKENRLIIAFLAFICTFLLVVVLKELKAIFLPLIFATLLSFALLPVVKFLGKFKIPWSISLTFLVLVIFLLFYLLGLVIYSSIASFAQEFPQYQENLARTFTTTLERLNLSLEQFQAYISNVDWNTNLKTLSLATVISSALGTFFNFLGYVLLILIITIFLLSGQLKIAQKIEKAFASERAKQIILLIKTIQRRVQTYLIAKTFIGLMTAVVGTVMILLFGVDFAIVAGLLIFILDFIPNIGSTIATIFPLLICFVQYGYSWKLPLLALCLIANQMFFSNLVSPMLMGRGLNLSPLVIILSLIFWGWVWGIVGMILAVPLTSTLVIIFENIETLKPIAVLMSGSSAKSGKKGLEQRK